MEKPNKASAAVKAAAGIADRGLLHRFRDTLKTRLSEHGVDGRVSEQVLGHVVPGIAGVYDHAELFPQRREALNWWDKELDRILKPKAVPAGRPIAAQRRPHHPARTLRSRRRRGDGRGVAAFVRRRRGFLTNGAGSATDSQSGGRGFDPPRSTNNISDLQSKFDVKPGDFG